MKKQIYVKKTVSFHHSGQVHASSGVPHRTVLGPLFNSFSMLYKWHAHPHFSRKFPQTFHWCRWYRKSVSILTETTYSMTLTDWSTGNNLGKWHSAPLNAK